MTAWFPAVDQALGGIADAVKGLAGTAGGVVGQAAGGATRGLANWMTTLAIVAGAAYVAARTL